MEHLERERPYQTTQKRENDPSRKTKVSETAFIESKYSMCASPSCASWAVALGFMIA